MVIIKSFEVQDFVASSLFRKFNCAQGLGSIYGYNVWFLFFSINLLEPYEIIYENVVNL